MVVKSTTLKLPASLHVGLQQRVITDGLGMRGKSTWIRMAIEEFFQLSDYPVLVDLASEMDALDATISVRLPEELLNQIEDAVLVIRKEFPLMEGVKSRIVRASIIQKLLR